MTTEIEQDVWGLTAEGEAIVRYRMRNACGAEVEADELRGGRHGRPRFPTGRGG